MSHGRCIEALVWYYRWTGDDLALSLDPERLARFHLDYAVAADGRIPGYLIAPDSAPGDRQSHLYTLCGLLLFGLLTRQPRYVDAVVRTWEVGVPEIVNECGWVAHDLGVLRFPDRTGNPLANTESTGAAARLALWMAMHTGRAECYDDVERLVRARLFPGQTTEADRRGNPGVEIDRQGDRRLGGERLPARRQGVQPERHRGSRAHLQRRLPERHLASGGGAVRQHAFRLRRARRRGRGNARPRGRGDGHPPGRGPPLRARSRVGGPGAPVGRRRTGGSEHDRGLGMRPAGRG